MKNRLQYTHPLGLVSPAHHSERSNLHFLDKPSNYHLYPSSNIRRLTHFLRPQPALPVRSSAQPRLPSAKYPPGGVKSRPARRGQRQNPREKERRNPFFHFVLLAPGPAGKSSIFLYYNRSSAKKQAKSPRFSPRGRIFMQFPCGKTLPGPRGPATGTAAG